MKKKKIALIFGISGQDGSYLAHFLLKKNYKVVGITRNRSLNNLSRLERLKILNKVKVVKGTALNKIFLNKLIKKDNAIKEIYYFAGDSSVERSFDYPDASLESNTLGILNILMSVKEINKKIKVFNATSGQIFGNKKKNHYSEGSLVDPQSPYGVAKASGLWLSKIYRETHNLYSCSGILFNHESPLRSKHFVTKKIVDTSLKMKNNNSLILHLGDIDVYRDWGWAPEYVHAMWLMLQQKKPNDFVIGSGKKYSIRDFVYEVFRLLKINKNRLRYNNKKFVRKTDIKSYTANTNLIKKKIKWTSKVSFKQIVFKMVYNELF
ncbi:GDP-mannose 4,6-dehydratase [Pelagibacteraceae bacterium]|nr:GDP-mannose 4,6-dehydratase [Candidatus Pelagibacter sp.]MDC1485743.1 GDP-mannose 4,6-dehydratase [Pelagibacteraceae bacterium]